MHPVFASLAASLALVTSLSAQGTSSWSVPVLFDRDGLVNASTGQPWAQATLSGRTQHMWGAADFAYQTPMTITRIRFYPREYTPSPNTWTGGTYQMQIQMSTSPLTPSTMSTTYAANIGADVTTVHNGAVQLLPGTTNAPRPLPAYVDLQLTTPFTYDPTQGALLIDFVTDGSLYTGGTTYFPAVDRYAQANAARVWHTGNTTNSTGTYEGACGLVMGFDFQFTGTHAAFSVDRTAVPSGGTVHFTDHSITSDAGGIQSYAWDFNGDGFTDSTLKNPNFTYSTPGIYSVSLTVTANTPGGQSTRTKAALITVANPFYSVPDLLQYQFNEVRGTAVANTATGAAFPAAGAMSNPGWHGDPGPGRDAFNGTEPGFGVTAIAGVNDVNWTDTGGALAWNGSISVSWWQRMAPGAPLNAWAYVFGGPGTPFAVYNRGGAYASIMFVGTPATGNMMCRKDIHNADWVHLCLVIDDSIGRASWFVDGRPSGTKSFAPGTHSIANTQFLVGKHDANPTHARYYAMDDFRVYGRALSYGEVLGTMLGENASVSRYGTACAGAGTEPTSGAIGRPVFGNSGFATTFSGGALNANQPLFVTLGLTAGAGLPVPLTPFGFACGDLETSIEFLFAAVTDGNGDAVVPLPVPYFPELLGLHLYSQSMTPIAVAQALDLNLQLH